MPARPRTASKLTPDCARGLFAALSAFNRRAAMASDWWCPDDGRWSDAASCPGGADHVAAVDDVRSILVTGSRDWTDQQSLARALYRYRDLGWPSPQLIHGDARGADRIAASFAFLWGWRVVPVPAQWSKHGKRAGYLRNAAMVEMRPDVCFAFILNGSSGATMCAELAENAGIPTYRLAVSA